MKAIDKGKILDKLFIGGVFIVFNLILPSVLIFFAWNYSIVPELGVQSIGIKGLVGMLVIIGAMHSIGSKLK